MKHSIKKRAKKVPLRIKLKVSLIMFLTDVKHWLSHGRISDSVKSDLADLDRQRDDYYNRDRLFERNKMKY